MENPPPTTASDWAFPSWLAPRLLPDGRFARAYDALGDRRRALLKRLIADHYALNPPRPDQGRVHSERLVSGQVRTAANRPRPFVLLLTDASLDAPALFLAALMPALCSGAAEVLVARLGARAAVPDALLAACELAGQERVAALGPVHAARLLADCAQSGLPGLVLHPDTPAFRRLLNRAALREALDASALRLAGLRPPRSLALWRDAPDQFGPERLGFYFGALPVEPADGTPGGYAAFAATPRDLLLAPDARMGEGAAARLLVAESRAGFYAWPELSPGLFVHASQAISTASTPHR